MFSDAWWAAWGELSDVAVRHGLVLIGDGIAFRLERRPLYQLDEEA